MGHGLVALPTMAGVASDPGGDSWSGSEGTCMAARARHRAKDEGRGGRGGGCVVCKGVVAGHCCVESSTAMQVSRGPECADPRAHTMLTLQ